ncbi:molybdopterin-dependent oxidoreductase [Paraconexibacter antarcticus]|uniref:Molybdopterin-dependent oxidoreductase n=1 Tax=Paraconexibacter antarcticus TaxID=2949664 RepID=A0ABY5DLF3_9ACTN|nr:molybdopterin-dependent oxidoreductase [Paraconexibacter antarcticus]UTI62648.1 molybdopterin-dependent oxidoreductase [Paraconexibacter antarcticus]
MLKDPDRLLEPQRRRPDGTFEPVSWDAAMADIGTRLRKIVAESGRESIGIGLGNANAWNYGAFLTLFGMATALKTKHFYTASSIDINGYWVVGELLYGNNLANPFPDFARTDFALILGANPVVSHGSMVTVGKIREVLLDIPKRGGRVVVVDPRRTETASLFEHVPIIPEGDPWLLAAILKVLVDERLVDRATAERQATGVPFALDLVRDVDLDRAAAECGIPRADIEQLARDLAAAPAACVYGRCGASLGRFATLTKYLIDVINIVTGNLDKAGGIVFGRPMIDLEFMTGILKANGYDRWRTRVDGIPEVIGTSPWATFPREVATPGPGQCRAMICAATNAATTSVNAKAMDEAFAALDLFVSLDPYVTDTNRHADYILPPKLLLEREAIPIFTQSHNAVPYAQWTAPVVDPPPGVRDDWKILDDICKEIGMVPSGAPGAQLMGRLGIRLPPHVGVDAFMRIGPDGDLFGLRRNGLSRKKLLKAGAPVKLADHSPVGIIRDRIRHKDRMVHLEHRLFADELERLRTIEGLDDAHPLRLFTIRELRSQNSWLHNVPKLMSGGRACRLRIHPEDAETRGLTDGAMAAVASNWGRIEVEVQVTDEGHAGLGRPESALGPPGRLAGRRRRGRRPLQRPDPQLRRLPRQGLGERLGQRDRRAGRRGAHGRRRADGRNGRRLERPRPVGRPDAGPSAIRRPRGAPTVRALRSRRARSRRRAPRARAVRRGAGRPRGRAGRV